MILNETLRVRCRLNNVSSNLRFLSECLFRGVVPKRISIRVKKMRAHHPLKLERAMIRDEISKVSEEKEKLRLKYRRYMSEVLSFLGCCDFVRFCRMVGECDDKQRRKCTVKYSRNIDWLCKERFGSFKCNEKFIVRNLVDRARRLCSSQKLLEELDMLRSLFRLNGYPESVISKFVTVVSLQSKMSLSDVKPVYLRLPWKGELVSRNFQHQVKSAVESSYHDVSVRFVYTTVRAFTVKKDALPTSQQSHVIYQFECRHCESRYVGRTLLHLNARIRQHVPLHLVPVSQRASRPRRGRQPKSDDGRPPRKPPDGQAVAG